MFYFNPRTHRGVRLAIFCSFLMSKRFQSTHPSWGATFRNYKHVPDALNFNPRTHRGVRHFMDKGGESMRLISIHAPIVGCDDGKPDNIMFVKEFQSTHPSWGATLICNHFFYKAIQISIRAPIVGCDDIYLMLAEMLKISIHAPIVGCDPFCTTCYADFRNFNPRTHRGVRPTYVYLW